MTFLWSRLLSDAVPRIGNAVQEGMLDPTAARRRRIATETGQVALDQARDELAHADFSRGLKAGDLQAKFGQLALDQGRLGFDQTKLVTDVEQKGLQREHEAQQLLDRSLGNNSAEALIAARQGVPLAQALAGGDAARAKRAGREAGARTAADTSIRTADAQKRGLMQRFTEVKMAAEQAGRPITDFEAWETVKREVGPGMYVRRGNSLTPEQRREEKVLDMLGRVASGGAQMGQKPGEAIGEFTSPEFGKQYGQWVEATAQKALGLPGSDQAPAGLPTLSEEEQMQFDILVATAGEDTSQWHLGELLQADPSLASLFKKIGLMK